MRIFISQTLLSVLLLALLQTSEVMAHAKTDVITVDNGDQLTGAIDSMTTGKLSFSTDYAGLIKIKWRDVTQINSRYLYEVRLQDGERIYGRFSPSEIAGNLVLYSGGRQRTLPTLDVVEIRSIEEQLADQLDLDLSTTFDANPKSLTLVLQATGSYDVRGGRTGFNARFEDIKTKSTDDAGTTIKEATQNSNFTLYREFWRDQSKATAQSYRVLNAIYSSNDALGVDHRGSIGFGFGRYFIQELGHELRMSAGVQGVQETRASCDEQVSGEDPEGASTLEKASLVACTDAELFINLQWHLYRFSDRDMDISLVGNAYPSLTDTKRFRGDLNLVVNWELFDSFFWSIKATTELDTAGTQDNKALEKTFFSISTGVTWKY
jgi:hypothetical protein